jgi:hypothetical protein
VFDTTRDRFEITRGASATLVLQVLENVLQESDQAFHSAHLSQGVAILSTEHSDWNHGLVPLNYPEGAVVSSHHQDTW